MMHPIRTAIPATAPPMKGPLFVLVPDEEGSEGGVGDCDPLIE